jgi:hypothetical protein
MGNKEKSKSRKEAAALGGPARAGECGVKGTRLGVRGAGPITVASEPTMPPSISLGERRGMNSEQITGYGFGTNRH